MLRFLLFLMISATLFAGGKTVVSTKTTPVVTNHTFCNINDIHCWVLSNGQTGHNPFAKVSGVVYPAETGTVVYSEGLLWAGWVRDGNNPELRSGGMQYRVSTQPGAVLPDGTIQNKDSETVRAYRIRRDWRTMSEAALISDAVKLYHLNAENFTPEFAQKIRDQYERDWFEWPAELGAPFSDLNGNAIYEPELGEEPGLAGADQVIWLVVNDLDPSQTDEMGGCPPLGLEVQITLWAYTNTIHPFEQTIFQRYRIINKSGSIIDSMYVGKWSDPDVGAYGYDFAGCDTTLNLAFVYNSSPVDKDYLLFGLPPPAVGYVHLQGPCVPAPGQAARFDFKSIAGYCNLPPLAFTYSVPSWFDPGEFWGYERTLSLYNRLRGYLEIPDIKRPVPYEHRAGPKKGQPTFFPLDGDPLTGEGDVDGLGDNMEAGERRFLFSAGPFTMQPGEAQEIIYALIGGIDYHGDHLSSLARLKENTAIIKNIFEDNLRLPKIGLNIQPADAKNTSLNLQLDLRRFDAVHSAVVKFSPEYGNETFFEISLNDAGQDNDSLAGDKIWSASKVIANRKYPFRADLTIQSDRGPEQFENIQNNLRLRPPPRLTDFRVIWENGRQDLKLNSGERARLSFTLLNPDGLNGITSLKLSSIQSSALKRELYYDTYIAPFGAVENPDFYMVVDASGPGDSSYVMLNMEYDRHRLNMVHAIPVTPWIPAEIKNDTLNVETINGLDHLLQPVIADPTQLTGHRYRVSFYRASKDQPLRWQLTDETLNQIIRDEPWTPQLFYDEYPIENGIEWRAPHSEYGIAAVVQVSDSRGPLPENTWNDAGRPYQGKNVWHSLNARTDTVRFYMSSGGVNSKSPDIYLAGSEDSGQPGARFRYENHDFEIRFEADNNAILYDWFDDHGYERQPISVWDIGLTWDDPSDDLRMLTGMYLPDTTTSFTSFSYRDLWTELGGATGWLYARSPLDEYGSYDVFYQDVTSGALTKDWWEHSVPALQRIIFCPYYSYVRLPQNGTVIRIVTRKHLLEGYTYLIDSPQAQPDQLYDYPRKYKLLPNYPNPFNTVTRIPFEAPEAGKVTLTIYNILGQNIIRLIEDHFNKGWHVVDWDGRDGRGSELSSGIYLIVLRSNKGQMASGKLVLIK